MSYFKICLLYIAYCLDSCVDKIKGIFKSKNSDKENN